MAMGAEFAKGAIEKTAKVAGKVKETVAGAVNEVRHGVAMVAEVKEGTVPMRPPARTPSVGGGEGASVVAAPAGGKDGPVPDRNAQADMLRVQAKADATSNGTRENGHAAAGAANGAGAGEQAGGTVVSEWLQTADRQLAQRRQAAGQDGSQEGGGAHGERVEGTKEASTGSSTTDSGSGKESAGTSVAAGSASAGSDGRGPVSDDGAVTRAFALTSDMVEKAAGSNGQAGSAAGGETAGAAAAQGNGAATGGSAGDRGTSGVAYDSAASSNERAGAEADAGSTEGRASQTAPAGEAPQGTGHSRSRADVEADLDDARKRETTYSYYRYSPSHTQAMNDVAQYQAELDALGPAGAASANGQAGGEGAATDRSAGAAATEAGTPAGSDGPATGNGSAGAEAGSTATTDEGAASQNGKAAGSEYQVVNGKVTRNGQPVSGADKDAAARNALDASGEHTEARTAQDTDLASRYGRTEREQAKLRTDADMALGKYWQAAEEFEQAWKTGSVDDYNTANAAYEKAKEKLHVATHYLDPRHEVLFEPAPPVPAGSRPTAAGGSGADAGPGADRPTAEYTVVDGKVMRDGEQVRLETMDSAVTRAKETSGPKAKDNELAGAYGRTPAEQAALRQDFNSAFGNSYTANQELARARDSGDQSAIDQAERAANAARDRLHTAVHHLDPRHEVLFGSGDAPEPGTPKVQAKTAAAPAAARAQERIRERVAGEDEHTSASWKPSPDGLVNQSSGEKVKVEGGDGTTPVVMNGRVYYDNGQTWKGPDIQGQRTAAAAAVQAVNQTGNATEALSTKTTAIHGHVMIDTNGNAPAATANVPEFKQALVKMHGGEVGPTVLQNVVLNPDGSLNSATMRTSHRQPDGSIKTVESFIDGGRIHVKDSNVTAMKYLVKDNVRTAVAGGPGGPDKPGGPGGGGGGSGGSGSSGGGTEGSGGAQARYIIIEPPGLVKEEVRVPFTGEISPAAARVLKRYYQEEEARKAGVPTTDGPTAGGEPGPGGRTKTRPGTGRTRPGREKTRARPQPQDTGQTGGEREKARTQGQEQAGQKDQGREKTAGQERQRADGRPDGRGQAQGRPGEQGRAQGRADGPDAGGEGQGRTRPKGNAQGQAGSPDAGGEAKGRRRATKPSARARARAAADGQPDPSTPPGYERMAPKAKTKTDIEIALADPRTLYAILGLPKGKASTEADILAAYRNSLKKAHTDIPGNQAPDEITKIKGAHELLSNTRKKAMYDMSQAVSHVLEAVAAKLHLKTDMQPGEGYDVGKAIGELGAGMTQEQRAAWAFTNLRDLIILLSAGSNEVPVDGAYLGLSAEALKDKAFIIKVSRQGGIFFRVDQVDSATGQVKHDWIHVKLNDSGDLSVKTSKSIAGIMGEPLLQEVGAEGTSPPKVGFFEKVLLVLGSEDPYTLLRELREQAAGGTPAGALTEHEKVLAALKLITDGLVLDFDQVKNADPIDIFNTAAEAAARVGEMSNASGGADPDKDPDDPDKGSDTGPKGKKDGKKKKEDEKDDSYLDKPFWQLTNEEKRKALKWVVDQRMAAIEKTKRGKKPDDANIRMRAGETMEQARARRIKEDKDKTLTQRKRVELQAMRDILDDLQYYKKAVYPQLPYGEQRQMKRAITNMKFDITRKMDDIMDDWKQTKGIPRKGLDTPHSWKEPRFGGKKKGNAHLKYSKEEMRDMKNVRHPNRPPNRTDGTGPKKNVERKANGKRKVGSVKEVKERRRVYNEARSQYLRLVARRKELLAQKSELSKHPWRNSRQIGVLSAHLKSVNHDIRMEDKTMRTNSITRMTMRAFGRMALNQMGV